jgi:hypothetical protein
VNAPSASQMCQHGQVSARKIAHCFCAVVVTAWSALLSAPLFFASASAATCPDIEVTFARATGEPPGVGVVGQEFIDALRSQVGGRSVAVYPVNYPASADLAPSANAGAVDANAHVESMSQHQAGARRVLPRRRRDRSDHDCPSTGVGLCPGVATARRGRSRCRTCPVRESVGQISGCAGEHAQSLVRREGHRLVRARRSCLHSRRTVYRADA